MHQTKARAKLEEIKHNNLTTFYELKLLATIKMIQTDGGLAEHWRGLG
jgi:hypothetical protein